jgi:hypothetical protein
LRGEGDLIKNVMESDIEAYVDISRYTEKGVYNVPVQVRRNGTAFNAEGLETTPDPREINMELGKVESVEKTDG